MTTDYKLTCIIIDDFSSRSLSEFSGYDIQYYDYAVSYTSFVGDSYGYYSSFDYGDIDFSGIVPGTTSYSWVNLNNLTGLSNAAFLGNVYAGASVGNFTGLYYGSDPEVIDYLYFTNIDSVTAWDQQAPGHGDWVLKAFTDGLNDKSDVEIIAIDIDYTASEFNSLFAPVTLDGKTVPFLTSLYNSAVIDLHQANEYHLLIGINASFTSVNASLLGDLAAIDSLLSDDLVVVQSAPNVTSSGIDWGRYLPNVINVGAWNVDQNGYPLAANVNSLNSVDLYANGYIERPGWSGLGSGWNFGTSFAAPRVFAEIVNLFDASVLPALDSGELSPGSGTNLSGEEETAITDQIISAITTEYLVSLVGLNDLVGPISISKETISDFGVQPIIVPYSESSFGYVFSNAQEFVNLAPDIVSPTVSTFSPLDAATGVAVASNIAVTFSESIQRGTGTIEIRSGSATGTIVETFDAATSSRLAISGSTLTIDPTNNLANSTQYFVVLPSGSIQDLAGNNYAGTTTYDFTTVAPVDTTAPVLSSASPVDGATGIAVGANFVLTFNEAVKAGTGNFVVSAGGATIATISVTDTTQVSFSGSTVTINPSADLAYSTAYSVTVASGVIQDLAGNNWAGTGANPYDFTSVNNTITGTSGNDNLVGTSADDVINGLEGDDTITGGVGADTMTGGAGSDVFVFMPGDSGTISGSYFDTITDYTMGVGGDRLDLPGEELIQGDLSGSDVSSAVVGEFGALVVNAAIHDGIITLDGADAGRIDSLVEWLSIARLMVTTNEAVGAFEFEGDTYLFQRNIGGDLFIRFQGITGVNGLSGESGSGGGPADPPPPPPFPPTVSGQIYHWKTGALLSGVDVSVNQAAAESAGSLDTTDGSGVFGLSTSQPGLHTLSASRVLTSAETGTVVSSADALAALKIAVGRNPNTDPDGAGPLSAPAVSPYQFLAADVNGDGKVTSADALAILKMAVRRSDAPAREWLFVDEQKDFWDEAANSFTTSRTSVPKPSDLGVSVDPTVRSEVNLVAVLKGDVNGSWGAPTGSQVLAASYFTDLATQHPNLIHPAQFGLNV